MKCLTRPILAAGLLFASAAQAQQAGPPPGMPSPEIMAQMRAAEARNNAMPDTPGSGRFAALKEADPSLPDHVVYRPADLSKLGSVKLGILAWGNGACSDDGANARQHLAEIASHGYLVIANGTIKSGPGVPPPPPIAMPAPGPNGERKLPPPRTTPGQLTQAIDWAIAENSRPDSPYFGRIDTSAVAVSGWSCGGLQALSIAASDARVKAVVIDNSGIFNQPMPGMGIDIDKSALAKLRAPILYLLGGPTDIAFANGMDDYARITTVPAMTANLDVGHGGTFYQPNGGLVAPVATAWLDWRLRGDAAAAKWFAGADCKLCTDSAWTIQRKGF
jgi:dienelactone hydrolase